MQSSLQTQWNSWLATSKLFLIVGWWLPRVILSLSCHYLVHSCLWPLPDLPPNLYLIHFLTNIIFNIFSQLNNNISMMAALQSEQQSLQPQDNTSPNVTLTIRLIMQGKVSNISKHLILQWPWIAFPYPSYKISQPYGCLPTEKLLLNMNTHTIYFPQQASTLFEPKLDDPFIIHKQYLNELFHHFSWKSLCKFWQFLQEVGSIIGKKGDIVKRFREEVS